MIDSIKETTGAPISKVCTVLEWPRSSYYHAEDETSSAAADREMSAEITEIFNHHRRRYGYRRVVSELADKQIKCAPARARRLMNKAGLHALQPKSYAPRTSDGKANAPSPNLLCGEIPEHPNKAWGGDITYIPTEGGWVYLAVVIDLGSRQIVGWEIADNMRSDLVTSALRQAIETRSPSPGLIFHSDRGSQYGSGQFRNQLAGAEIRQSMSARANPYDNAWTESFFGTLKGELIQDGCFENISDARAAIFEYIEAYYNTQRKHSSLGNITPNQYEKQTGKSTLTLT
jgi:putative transposase